MGKIKKKSSQLSRDAMKAKRRKMRKRMVIMQRVCIVALAAVLIGGGGFAVIWNLPFVKLSRQLSAGQEYEEEAAYQNAIESYEKAIQIDSTSVKAYQCMAGTYLNMQDDNSAKKILFEGWETTQDESLLNYYCTVILNEAVGEINENKCTLETVEKIVSVLEQNTANEDALTLIHTAYEHLKQSFSDGSGEEFFYDQGEAETCNFTLYEQIMNRLFTLYRADSTDELKSVISEFGMLPIARMKVSMRHMEAYNAILETVNELAGSDATDNLIACLKKEREIQNIFDGMFLEFDAGNYEAAKEFIVSDTYIQIRDAFIDGTMEFWKGETMIPVSREAVILTNTDGAWTFEYPDFKDNEKTSGIITVWGSKLVDSGIQRSCISYEPAEEAGNYYPHTEYTISYMSSNVQKKNSFKEEMNYHLETRVWTEEGTTTDMIGDWGGPYQWEKEY